MGEIIWKHDYNMTIHILYYLGSSGTSGLKYDKVTVAQHGPERSAFNRVVGGSNPPRDTLGTWYNGYYAIIFRDYRDAGSSPAGPLPL